MAFFTGTIGFLLASAMLGAVLLLVSDCIAKNIGMAGMSAGAITALIGGPIFLYLLIRSKQNTW